MIDFGEWPTHSILFRVDPITGHRTILSDFKNPAQGPSGDNPSDLAIDESGNILVIDFEGLSFPDGALFSVDPITGDRTLISDFSDISQGPLGRLPLGVYVDPSGTIFVADEGRGLFSVDPISGNRTLITNFGGGSVLPSDVQGFLIQPDTAPGLVSIPSTINKAGDNTAIRFCAGSNKLHVTDAEIIDPTGASFFDASGGFDMAANQCFTWNTGIDFPGFSTNELGTYAVQINTDRGIFASDFSVPLFMIPESPLHRRVTERSVAGVLRRRLALALGGHPRALPAGEWHRPRAGGTRPRHHPERGNHRPLSHLRAGEPGWPNTATKNTHGRS